MAGRQVLPDPVLYAAEILTGSPFLSWGIGEGVYDPVTQMSRSC